MNRQTNTEGKQLPSKLVVPFFKKIYSKRKEFASPGSKFFPLSVDPFSEAACCTEKQTRSHKIISLVNNGRKAYTCLYGQQRA